MQSGIMGGMDPTRPDYAALLSSALVVAIKLEMVHRNVPSTRALGRMIGKSSQYMSERLDGGSSRTGRRVTLTTWDIAAIAQVLGLTSSALIAKAERLIADGEVRGDEN